MEWKPYGPWAGRAENHGEVQNPNMTGNAEDSYAQGKNDREISKELGCDPHTVYLWRKKSGLAANAGARGKPVRQVSQGESGLGK